jgi:hypothetical protein
VIPEPLAAAVNVLDPPTQIVVEAGEVKNRGMAFTVRDTMLEVALPQLLLTKQRYRFPERLVPAFGIERVGLFAPGIEL